MTFPAPTGPPFAQDVHKIPPSLQPTGPSAEQVAAWRHQFIEMLVRTILLAFKGFFTPGRSSFDQLQEYASTHDIGFFREILTGVTDANDHDLASWVNTLLRHHRPVPAIQAASVVDTNPNLVLMPNFPDTSTVVADQNWSWSNTFGHDSIGCAQVVAAGYISEAVTNEIAVVEDQKLDLSVWVKWTGAIYTGTDPIVMGVTRYKRQVRPDGLVEMAEIGSDDLVTITPVPSSTAEMPFSFPFTFGGSSSSDSDWRQMLYTAYPVPSDCDEIRLRFKIDSNLAAGSVFWDDASVTKTQPGSGYIGTFLDNTINGLENLNRPGWGPIDILITMLGKFRTIGDHGARITLLENLNSPNNKINDEFLRTGATLGPNWNITYSGAGAGTWQTDGDYAIWNESGVGTREVRGRYIGAPFNGSGAAGTINDNQRVLAILGSKGEALLGFVSHVDLYGRMNTTGTEGTDYVRARFSANGNVTITRRSAGVDSDLAAVIGYNLILNPNGPKPAGANSTVEFIVGTASGPRFFEARISGELVLSASDSTSALGSDFRGYGAGVRAEGSLIILGQASPAKLNAWAAVDTT